MIEAIGTTQIRPPDAALPDLRLDKPAKTDQAPSFQDMLTNLLADVDKAQTQADASIQNLAAGKENTSIQDVVVRMEEADLAFRLMKEIRDKLVAAYKEIMSTQV
ncbi:MAG: flagellar hook-basal body complex protein FliE [Lentisphaerae bacterium RIFOXYB12_FULL_65_16]|nr:MAG: flagellar hook-basal body complex protein FliE [Lentisphaerae bacterium RIFOXYA12_64_32]OGV88882.1 MAG: flagellar hook-basal body complex protein FliE [Lentisphaerae bacterium RIFOXYB12_FULL_65_16]